MVETKQIMKYESQGIKTGKNLSKFLIISMELHSFIQTRKMIHHINYANIRHLKNQHERSFLGKLDDVEKRGKNKRKINETSRSVQV